MPNVDPGKFNRRLVWQTPKESRPSRQSNNQVPVAFVDANGSRGASTFWASVEPLRGAALVAASDPQIRAVAYLKILAWNFGPVQPGDRFLEESNPNRELSVISVLATGDQNANLEIAVAEMIFRPS